MSGPWAEDGRLPPLSDADRERIAAHEQRIADALAGRAEGGDSMSNPTGGEDWHSQDDPPPKKPEPKPDTGK